MNIIEQLEARIENRRAKLLEAVEASISEAIAKINSSEVVLGFDPLTNEEINDVMDEVVNVGAYY